MMRIGSNGRPTAAELDTELVEFHFVECGEGTESFEAASDYRQYLQTPAAQDVYRREV